MRGLGNGVKEFKNASEGADDIKSEIDKTSSDLKKSPPEGNKSGNTETKDEGKKE